MFMAAITAPVEGRRAAAADGRSGLHLGKAIESAFVIAIRNPGVASVLRFGLGRFVAAVAQRRAMDAAFASVGGDRERAHRDRAIGRHIDVDRSGRLRRGRGRNAAVQGVVDAAVRYARTQVQRVPVLLHRHAVAQAPRCRDAEIDAGLRQARILAGQPPIEGLELAQRLRRPRDLGQGQQAREHHVLEHFLARNALGPYVGLHAEDVVALAGLQFGRHRIVGIDRFDGQFAALLPQLAVLRSLAVVEITASGRRHDHVVAMARGGDAAGFATP